jgi:lipoate-protein ligase A
VKSHDAAWSRHEWVGTAHDFHAQDLPSGRAVWSCEVTQPCIILGSAQPASDVDTAQAAALGLSIAKRRSGGGAVFVSPTDSVWIDVTIPKDDPLWVDDVSASMLWLGDAFVRALAPWVNAETFRGTFETGVDGRTVCFASTSPGEVFVNGEKLVGISQRRGRHGARLQCVLYRQWNPHLWTPVLTNIDVRDRVNAMRVATLDISADLVVDALLQQLP